MKTMVLGGARSGKSSQAQQRCEAVGTRLAYIATGQAFDAEMSERIARHRSERDARWWTLEAPVQLADAIREAEEGADAILVDCLTLWLSNLLLGQGDLAAQRDALLQAVEGCRVPITLVANEVGLSIVPENKLARLFRDEAGWLNQKVAALCDTVIFVAAGLPMFLKGS